MEKPTITLADIKIEGPVAEYLSELLQFAKVLSPGINSTQEIEESKPHAIAWITRSTPLRSQDIEIMLKLKFISAWGVGYNHIDVGAATSRNIPVCINPVFSRSIAEAALTFILALSKRLPLLIQDAHTGRNTPQYERGKEIKNKNLGLVGFGRIGRETGELAQRLEMIVQTYDPYLSENQIPHWCSQVSLETLLRTSDFIVITAPLTLETHYLIGAQQLSIMKPEAYLINIARGGLVDEKALFNALQEGKIAGAGIDVWEQEPPNRDDPLLNLENVISTPHKIGATWESVQNVCQSIQDNVFRILDNQKPLYLVNPQIYESSNGDIK